MTVTSVTFPNDLKSTLGNLRKYSPVHCSECRQTFYHLTALKADGRKLIVFLRAACLQFNIIPQNVIRKLHVISAINSFIS